jgi:Adenylate and Guanylate cyclase catalytic domain
MTATRRLTAILAADVAGYSRLMGQDEEGTHERLRGHLRELVETKIAEHHGRIVKTTGDGFLAEFPSVVDAVRCGVEIQRGMAERNGATPPRERIEFRIGVNLGDVIAEDQDIFGDWVNIAARLEALADPGGSALAGWSATRSRPPRATPVGATNGDGPGDVSQTRRLTAILAADVAGLLTSDRSRRERYSAEASGHPKRTARSNDRRPSLSAGEDNGRRASRRVQQRGRCPAQRD